MHRFFVLLTLATCAVAVDAAAQSRTFAFEGAAETTNGTRTVVQDSTAGVGLTVASPDTDWQARDVNGYGSTTGRAAYALVSTAQVTLSFSTPVRVTALHGATVWGEETWTVTASTGENVTATVTSAGTRIETDFPATATLTITSSVGAFFPLLDDIEVDAATAAPTATAPDAPIAGLDIDIFPQPVADAARIKLNGTAGAVRIAVYDVLGRQVAMLHDGPTTPRFAFDFDARTLAAGTYVLTVEAGENRHSQAFVVAR